MNILEYDEYLLIIFSIMHLLLQLHFNATAFLSSIFLDPKFKDEFDGSGHESSLLYKKSGPVYHIV